MHGSEHIGMHGSGSVTHISYPTYTLATTPIQCIKQKRYLGPYQLLYTAFLCLGSILLPSEHSVDSLCPYNSIGIALHVLFVFVHIIIYVFLIVYIYIYV